MPLPVRVRSFPFRWTSERMGDLQRPSDCVSRYRDGNEQQLLRGEPDHLAVDLAAFGG